MFLLWLNLTDFKVEVCKSAKPWVFDVLTSTPTRLDFASSAELPMEGYIYTLHRFMKGLQYQTTKHSSKHFQHCQHVRCFAGNTHGLWLFTEHGFLYTVRFIQSIEDIIELHDIDQFPRCSCLWSQWPMFFFPEPIGLPYSASSTIVLEKDSIDNQLTNETG